MDDRSIYTVSKFIGQMEWRSRKLQLHNLWLIKLLEQTMYELRDRNHTKLFLGIYTEVQIKF